ncbi:rhodanese-like domain-containing protein [Patulibacter brassicae]|jgi:rhodanese-related sulfurtransferase|uniref:Rhodanese-like domain-containing protein n=1 Tax=Patulibacter brassicae TaxID=1705717 RepID=A0ABU4VIX1_9ACTN|nr:rhodanese-like domain-containing protein [Patulibacter brassicae]MDX8151350.1 rhodanese-like domain-containing protein [Patulibacter brassicae]
MAELPIEIDAATLEDALARDEVVLVDVREPYEWEAGRIPGAHHVPLDQLGPRSGRPPLDGEKPIVFQCRVGGRSLLAAQAFRQHGYPAASLQGGILDWAAGGRALEPDGGTVAEH